MTEFFAHVDEWITIFLQTLGIYGPILGCFFICIESMIPVLPLSVFITLNFLSFGSLVGFIISWVCTIIGCMISFSLFRGKVRIWFEHKIRKNTKVDAAMKIVEKMNFQQLVLVIAMPFTPAFLVNIAAGLSAMTWKKFLAALTIGKAFMVYFWGYVGTTLVQSLKNPSALIKVVIMMLLAYIVSTLINKKFRLDEVK